MGQSGARGTVCLGPAADGQIGWKEVSHLTTHESSRRRGRIDERLQRLTFDRPRLAGNRQLSRRWLARGHGVGLFAFGGAYWPLALCTF